MQYSDGTEIKVGHVVVDRQARERYIVLGADNTFVKLLMIATVIKQDSPSLGKTIILHPAFTRNVPASELTKVGYALIDIVDEDPVI